MDPPIFSTEKLRSTNPMACQIYQFCIRFTADPRVKQVEVVFDDRRHATGIKGFLQEKRAEAAGGAAADATAELIRDSRVLHTAKDWGKLLASAKQKRQLIGIISKLLPGVVAPFLSKGQTFLVAGGFDSGPFKNKARVLTRRGGQIFERVGEEYLSNHVETDQRAWFHVRMCPYGTVTVFSPDSDVLMVGLLTSRKWSAAGGPRS